VSTGLNCTFEEIEPDVWYYALETGMGPKSAWDWREYADAFGPFPTEEIARDHLHRHHANPGGYCVNRFVDRKFPISETLKTLIEKARK